MKVLLERAWDVGEDKMIERHDGDPRSYPPGA